MPDRHRARRLREQRQVPAQQRALGEDRQRRPARGERLDDPGHEPVAALDPLVRVGVGAERHVLARPRRPRELGAQHLDDVRLDDDLRLEVPPGVQVEVLVRRPGEAVARTRGGSPASGSPSSGTASRDASGTLFSALLHVTSWNVTPANSGVRTLRCRPGQRQPGQRRRRRPCRSFCPSHRMTSCEHVFERASSRHHPRPQVGARPASTYAASASTCSPERMSLTWSAARLVVAQEPHERDAPAVGVPDLLAELGGGRRHLDRDPPRPQRRRDGVGPVPVPPRWRPRRAPRWAPTASSRTRPPPISRDTRRDTPIDRPTPG